MKKLICITASALLLASCFTACGKNKSKSSDSKFVGNWQSTKLISDGTEMTEFFGIPLNSLVHLIVEDNGKCRIESPLDSDESEEGTWEEDGDKLTVVFELSDDDSKDPSDNTQILEYKDGNLVFSAKEVGVDGELILEKVEEFATFDMDEWKDSLQQSFGGIDLGGLQ